MALFIVTYDLRDPARDYEPLYERLRVYTHTRPLPSAWFIELAHNAAKIRDNLEAAMDPGDGLLVLRIDGQAGWNGLDAEFDLWLLRRLQPSVPPPAG